MTFNVFKENNTQGICEQYIFEVLWIQVGYMAVVDIDEMQ